jgi:hypothetical protein
MYLATRGLYNLKPATVFVPPCIKEDVEKLLQIHRTMSQVELEVDLIALDVGMQIFLPFSLVAHIYECFLLHLLLYSSRDIPLSVACVVYCFLCIYYLFLRRDV